jgi:hypothetical protein
MHQFGCATPCASFTSHGAYNSFPGGGMKPFFCNWFRKCCAERGIGLLLAGAVFAVVTFCAANIFAENCTTAADIEPATRTALLAAGQRYFDFIAKGDSTSLRQNVIPSLASDFSGIESTVKENQSALSASKGTARSPFLLEASGTAPIARAEFYCGVFGRNGQTADSAAFYLNNLPPGKYAVVILDAPTSKSPYTVSLILQQEASAWKLGGLYIKAAQTGGHDSDWFLTRGRDFKTKGQAHNAWLYYLEARSLVSPLPFMSTAATDKLYDESQKAQPADLPANGTTVDLPAGTTTYKLIDLFPEVVGNDLDLIVKYQIADASNTNLAYSSNVAVMKALVAKYPELRDAFAGVVARAVDASGRDYGTLLAMKDIK